MFGFQKRREEKKAAEIESAAQTLRRLAKAAAMAGDLNDADGEAFEQAAATLGLPMSGEGMTAAAYVETIGAHFQDSKAGTEKQKADAAADEAASKATA